MKKILIFLLLVWAGNFARGQTIVRGTITGSGCVGITATGAGVVGISVTNTGTAWSGTIQPQVAIGGDPAQNTSVFPYGSTTSQSTITNNNTYQAFVTGADLFQVCGNTVTNTAAIKLTASPLAGRLGGGGGGGGTNNPGGSAGQIQTNAGAVFGAFTASGDATINTTTGVVTVTKTNGTAFGTFATANAATPPAIGNTTPAAGAFTTLSASSTVSGTGFSTYLASPPAIGGTAAAAGSFTTLSASSTVSGSGFSTYLASPPAIGGTAAAAGSFTTLSASGTVSGTGFSAYLASPPAIGGTVAAAGTFAGLTGTGTVDFSGSTIFKARVGAGLTTSANGDIGYDTTNKNWHAFQNAVDAYVFTGPVSGTYTNNDCVKFGVSSSVITLVDAGAACGSGGGSGLSGMTAGQVPIAATATTVTSSKAIQGTDTNLLSSGTVSGTGSPLCTDANGGATTSGCGAGSGTVTSVGLSVNSGASSGIFAITGSPVTNSGTLNFNLSGTSGHLPYFSNTTTLSNDANLDDGATTTGALTYAGSGGIISAPGGSNFGQITMTGNTGTPTIPANSVAWGGPPVASFTSYGMSIPSTAPAAGQVLVCGAPVSSWSTCAWANNGAGTTTNSLTMNNSGSGAASGSAFNGSAAVTLSYNTLGAIGGSGLTTGVIPQATGSNTIGNSSPQLDNGVTTSSTLTYAGTGGFVASAGPIASTGPSGDSGYFYLAGNTANQTVVANSVGFMGPSSASFTKYAMQLPSSGIGPGTVMQFGNPASNISAVSFTSTPTFGASGTAGTVSMFPASGNFQTTLGSAATASNTVNFFATVPANNDLFYCAVSSTTCTLTDAGYAYNAIPNADLAHSSITISPQSQTCTLGSSCTIPLSAVNPQTATYQVLASDFSAYKTIAVSSGTFTITLVASGSQPAAGQYIDITNYGSGTVTIARSGQNVNGGTSSLTLGASSATAPQSVRIESDGTNYVTDGIAGTGSGGGGSSALSAITAATGSNTISNGNNPQTWQSSLTTNSTNFFNLTESAAGTATSAFLLNVATSAGSTVEPVSISNSLTGSQTLSALSITPTWNTTGVVDAALLINPTNTASGSGSLLIDAQLGGTSRFEVDKAGDIGVTSATNIGGNNVTANITFCGGNALLGCISSTNGIVGLAQYQGQDNSSTGSSAKAGAVILRGGMLTGAANAAALEGVVQVGEGYLKGAAIAAVGDVVCGTSTAFTVTDCPHATQTNNIVGIATTTANPIGVVSDGMALVTLDGAVTALGDVVCLSTTTDGQGHDNGSTTLPCASGTAIGVIIADSGTITQMSGAGTAATAMSTTLALVQLKMAPSGAPCTATANALQYNNAGILGCATPFTFASSTITSAAAGILDMSAATGTAALKVPVAAGETATAAGAIDFDSTNKNFHGYVNGADSIFANFASAPTTNVIPKASISSGNTLLVNSSITDNGTVITTSEPFSNTLTNTSNSLGTNTGSGLYIPGTSLTAGDVYYEASGGLTPANACSFAAFNVTFTNGSAVIAGTNSLNVGCAITLTTTGSLPTNFATATTYYVIATGLSTTQFEVASSLGGSAISAGSAGSGTQTTNPVNQAPGICLAISTTQCMYNGTYRYAASESWTAGQIIYLSDFFGGEPAADYGATVNGTATSGTATFTNSSAVIAITNTLAAGNQVIFTTTNTLPTNFSPSTLYYVISTGLSGSQFEVSATPGGSAITAGSAGTGTQTVYLVQKPSPSGRYLQRLGVALASDTIQFMPSIDVGTIQ